MDYCFEKPQPLLDCDHGDGTSGGCMEWPQGCGEDLTCECAGAALCGTRSCADRRSREIFCVGEAAPSCDGHELNETWWLDDGCNHCVCRLDGMHCGDRSCPAECRLHADGYEALLAGAKGCVADSDCQFMYVDCQMRNRWVEYTNQSITAADLDAMTDAWLAIGCHAGTKHSCGCGSAPPRDAVCLDGQCVPEPKDPGPCGNGMSVGATDRIVGCNVCSCTEEGLDCTDHACPETCEEVEILWETVLPSTQACASGEWCHARFGPAWVTGLGDCWVPMNSKDERAWSQIVEEQWFALGCHDTPQPCTPDAEAECVDGVCVLMP